MTPVIVAQLGARRRYSVPHVLNEAGVLSTLFTDFVSNDLPKSFRNVLAVSPSPHSLRRLVARHPDLPREKIVAFNSFGLAYAWRLKRTRTLDDRLQCYLWAGRKFCQLILRHGLPHQGAVYTYNSAALEVLQAAKQQQLTTILDQTIAPQSLENEILSEVRHQFPGWEKSEFISTTHEYAQREEKEWQLADIILCGSSFVRDALVVKGIPKVKCKVVPTGGISLHTISNKYSTPYDAERPLRVLFVGTVSLRKGIHVLCKAFEQIPSTVAECRVVGPIQVSPQKLHESAPPSLSIVGAVPNSEINAHYNWADVFCLPSLCEGSAMVTYEALAHGLPLIVTPNTGAIIQHNQEGLIVSPHSSDELREAILKLSDAPDLLVSMAKKARLCAEEASYSAYANRLIDAIGLTDKSF